MMYKCRWQTDYSPTVPDSEISECFSMQELRFSIFFRNRLAVIILGSFYCLTNQKTLLVGPSSNHSIGAFKRGEFLYSYQLKLRLQISPSDRLMSLLIILC